MKHLVVLHFLFIKEENLSKRGTFFCLLHKPRNSMDSDENSSLERVSIDIRLAMKNALQNFWPLFWKVKCSSKQLGKRLRSLITHPSAAKHPQNPVLIYWLSTRIRTYIIALRWILDFMASWTHTLSAQGQRNKWWLSPKMLYFLNVFDLKFSKRSKILNALWGKKRVGQRKLSSICVFAYC